MYAVHIISHIPISYTLPTSTTSLPLILSTILNDIQEPTRRRNHKLATRPIINKQKRHLERIFVEDTESDEYFGNSKHEERQHHRHRHLESMPNTEAVSQLDLVSGFPLI